MIVRSANSQSKQSERDTSKPSVGLCINSYVCQREREREREWEREHARAFNIMCGSMFVSKQMHSMCACGKFCICAWAVACVKEIYLSIRTNVGAGIYVHIMCACVNISACVQYTMCMRESKNASVYIYACAQDRDAHAIDTMFGRTCVSICMVLCGQVLYMCVANWLDVSIK